MPRSDFLISRWLFLRLLGLVYAIAFVSLWLQIHGLVGSQGILPAQDFLNAAQLRVDNPYLQLPTICWLGCSDTILTWLCGLGTAASVMLALGIAPIPSLILLWTLYLSLSVVGQLFLSFQWDTLLLETGFFAIFVAPGTLLPNLTLGKPPNRIALWLLWWLLFKLTFLSGVTKLLSGDPTWRNLTAMEFHYMTQPIPNSISWYAHQLPPWWQKTTVVMTFAAELVVPLLIFAPRFLRHVACLLLIGLQLTIEATGNFCFFNLLTITLCVPLLDDRLLYRFLPARWVEPRPTELQFGTPWPRTWSMVPLSVLFLVSLLTFVQEMVRTQDPQKLPRAVTIVLDTSDRWLLSWGEPYVLSWTRPFRTINGYGLFRVMTTERPEIILEGSQDGVNWLEFQFRWKPGDLTRRPSIVAPHQPRLDWQMWFAALNPRGNEYWLNALMLRLLEGSPEVTGLLEQAPFRDQAPRYIRLVYYRYEFTTGNQDNGNWWRRTKLGALTPAYSLPRG